MKRYKFILGGEWREGREELPVEDKYSGEIFAQVSLAGPEDIEEAIARAYQSRKEMARLPSYRRKEILLQCASEFRNRREELAQLLCAEAGKPIRDSRGEVNRLIDTFEMAASEVGKVSGAGEVIPLDLSARAVDYTGFWKRVPVGVCSFITPFNFPLNLVAHKIAPAIAAGCPFLLKPSELTPVSALVIGEILMETGLPKGSFSILPCHVRHAAPLVEDERIKFLSFTGSDTVGWYLKSKAGKKRVALELGGNAACVLDEDTDIDDAVGRIVIGGFYQSGQSCISVQRILVHSSIYERFREKLVEAVKGLKMGDPRDEETFIGPLISDEAADRVKSWIDSAVKAGAKLLCGGGRNGKFVEPTLLENVPHDNPLWEKEVFGPVAVIESFDDFDRALELIDESRYGLQAGIFTRDIYKIQKAWDLLEVGGVIIGDIPSWRVDHMPYGGTKDSGLGREGLKFAIEEMTEIKLLAIRNPKK